jgi:two-component system copper resistance phosphate regulon response regulator CusR
MNRALHRVRVGGVDTELSPKEFAMLEYFITRLDQVVTRTKLIEHVWDDSFDSMSNVVDVTIFRLRSKIDGGHEGKLLQTIKGVGYILRGARS